MRTLASLRDAERCCPIRLVARVCGGGYMESSKSRSPFVGPIRTMGVRATGTEQTGVDEHLFRKSPKVQAPEPASVHYKGRPHRITS